MKYDVTELHPGDEIAVEDCESLIESKQTDRNYPMLLVGLAKSIEASLWRIGRQYTVRCQGNGIRILTHIEAAEYGEATYESGKRKMRLAHRRGMAVDTSAFPEDVRKKHVENLAKQGRQLSALRQRASLELEATKKTTPIRSEKPSECL
jgi:hypothetical protein